MLRSVLTCAFLVLATAAFAQQQQQTTSPSPYEGQSHPPADDNIVVTPPPDQPTPKPQAGTPMPSDQAQPAAPATDPAALQQQLAPGKYADSSANDPDVNGTDEGIVHVAPAQRPTALVARTAEADPDGDIVHPGGVQPGQVADGTTIRVHLLTPLSSADSQRGQVFRTRVASDVVQDGQVVIPAGTEIDGHVAQVSSGTARSHGTILLRPDTLTLANGSQFHLDAQVTGTPGSKTWVSSEGFINPGSRYKKDGMEYGGAVGAGVVAGALIAGPVGAVTGGIIGAGAMTAHVMTDHSEAVLESGAVLLFTLDNHLNLPANTAANQ